MSIEFIAQEFWDYVSESATPVALKMMEGNFLFVEIADANVVEARITTSRTIVNAISDTDALDLFSGTDTLSPGDAYSLLENLFQDVSITTFPEDFQFQPYTFYTADQVTSDTTVGTTRTLIIDGIYTYIFTPTQVTINYDDGEVISQQIFNYSSYEIEFVVEDDEYTISFFQVTTGSYSEDGGDPETTTYSSSTTFPQLYVYALGISDIDDVSNGQEVPGDIQFFATIYNNDTVNYPSFTDNDVPSPYQWLSGAFDFRFPLANGTNVGLTPARQNGISIALGDLDTTTVDHDTTDAQDRVVYDDASAYIGTLFDTAGVEIDAADLAHFDTDLRNFFVYQDIIWNREFDYADDIMLAERLRVAGQGTTTSTSTSYGTALTADTFTIAVAPTANGQTYWEVGDVAGASYTKLIHEFCIPRSFYPDQYQYANGLFYMNRGIARARKWQLKRRTDINSIGYHTNSLLSSSTGGGWSFSGGTGTFMEMVAAAELAFYNFYGFTIYENGVGGAIWIQRNIINGKQATYTLISNGTQYAAFNVSVITSYSLRYWLDYTDINLPECEAILSCGFGPTVWMAYDSTLGTFSESATAIPALSDPDYNTLCLLLANPGNSYILNHQVTGPMTGFFSSDNLESTVTFNAVEYSADAVIFPDTTFNLQNGTPAPVYPTYQGAFVYDLELQKWGKMKMSFLSLLDFAPVNTQSSQLLPNARYGVAGGILDADGAIYQWDANPTDAYIKYGKFSLFRLGITTIQEIEAQFGIQSTGTLETETSLDGKTIDLSLSTSYDFSGARVVKAPISKAGVWHNIILRGQFDLTYLQVNAYRSGRR